MTIENSCKFLKNLIDDFPAKITHILTDNGVQFTATAQRACSNYKQNATVRQFFYSNIGQL